jgi:sugar (pentulose or hexulose) kinase
MTSRHQFLAFDFGAESGRSILATLDAGKLSLNQTHRFANPNGSMNGTLQWDLLGQWEQIKAGLRETAKVLDGKLDGPLSGIAVDTWGVDYGLLGADGAILGNPVCYRDTRTDGMMDHAFSIVPKRELYEQTGLQFMPFNTLFQLLAQVKRGSSTLASASTLLFVPDLFNYLLTGVARAEFSIASTSQMIDPRTGQWEIDLLKKLGIPTQILPPIIASGTMLGPLLDSVVKDCGISGDVIATTGHDTASAVAAVPAEGGNWAYLSSGTWSLMGVELERPLINDKSFAYNYTNEGGINGTTRFLKNIMGLWLVQECRREFEKQGRSYDYATLTKMAAESEPFVSLVSATDNRFLTPGQIPQKIAEFCSSTGQPVPKDDGAFIRCCLDSLALEYRKTIDGLEDVLGKKLDVLHIVGGGTQNELLNQLTADATRKTVITGPIEATAIGNVIVQAMAVGAIKNLDEARRIVKASSEMKTCQPRADVEAAYGRYRALGS